MLKQIENLTEEEIIEIVKCSTGFDSINSIVLDPFSKINRDKVIKISYSFIESSDKAFKEIRGDVSICYFNEDNLSNNKNDADYLCDVYFEILWDYSIVLLVNDGSDGNIPVNVLKTAEYINNNLKIKE